MLRTSAINACADVAIVVGLLGGVSVVACETVPELDFEFSLPTSVVSIGVIVMCEVHSCVGQQVARRERSYMLSTAHMCMKASAAACTSYGSTDT
jgi:hypothetical protein